MTDLSLHTGTVQRSDRGGGTEGQEGEGGGGGGGGFSPPAPNI